MRRLAREIIHAADGIGEGVATLDGLMHMVNAWERGARPPSEMYWLIYCRLFPELANDIAAPQVTAAGEALRRAAELPGPEQIDAMEAAALRAGGTQMDSSKLEELRLIQKQVAEISQRLAELIGESGEGGSF